MNFVVLTENHLFLIIIVAAICLTIGWICTFLILRNKESNVKELFYNGNLIKLLTVIFVVFTSAVLTVMGIFTEAISTIFAGISGYVLGSIAKTDGKQ